MPFILRAKYVALLIGSLGSRAMTTSKNNFAFEVFTDASLIRSGSSTRAAYAMVWPNRPDLDRCGKMPDEKDSNRAETYACLCAFDVFEKEVVPLTNCTDRPASLKIYTDSMHVVRGIKRLRCSVFFDMRKGDTRRGKIEDSLLKELFFRTERFNVSFEHVKAHTSLKGETFEHNRRADRMARSVNSESALPGDKTSEEKKDLLNELRAKRRKQRKTKRKKSRAAQRYRRIRRRFI